MKNDMGLTREKNRRCIGLTKNLRRCQRRGNWLLFCDDHWTSPIKWTIFSFTLGGSIASIIALLLFCYSDNNTRVFPFPKAFGEKIKYISYEEIANNKEIAKDDYLDKILSEFPGGVYNIGIRKGIDYIFCYEFGQKTMINRIQLGSEISPKGKNFHFLGCAEEYEKLFPAYESAIVIYNYEGASGVNMDVSVVMWNGHEYAYLFQGSFSRSTIEFIDVDDDGIKEIIVKEWGFQSEEYDPPVSIQVYKFEEKDMLYKELLPYYELPDYQGE